MNPNKGHFERPLWLNRFLADIIRYRKGIVAAGVVCLVLQLAFQTVCPMRLLTGLPCPGCGLTRAFLAFFSGNPAKAWSCHPLFAAVLIGIPLFAILRYITPEHFRFFRLYAALVLAAAILLYLYRMATLFPDTEPMLFYKDDMLVLRILSVLRRLRQ